MAISCAFLRGKETFGIICGKNETSAHKKLASIIKKEQSNIVSTIDLTNAFKVAELIQQSPASLLYAILPKKWGQKKIVQKKNDNHISISITPEEIANVKEILAYSETKKSCFAVQGDFETGIVLVHALMKKKRADEQILVLVPRDRDAEILMQTLRTPCAAVTGTTKEEDRAHAYTAWKNQNIQLLIGTKQVALWSAPKLAYVVVLHAGNDEYAHLRRNPKFDPREAARVLACAQNATYISVDTLPRIENTEEDTYFAKKNPPETPRFIALANKEEKTPYPLITATLREEIENASQNGKKVLLFLNRKGAAKRLQCVACNQVPLCGTCGNLPTVRANDLVCDRCGTEMWIPELCPLCNKPKLKFVGVGGEKVVADLQKIFPHMNVGFIEKKEDSAWKTANILVATEHIFANLLTPFTRYNFGLVADLMADLPVGGVDFRASEHTARQLLRLSSLAKREKATCLIQTWLPERLPTLLSATYVIEEELRIRNAYLLPPFGKIYSTTEHALRNPHTPPSTPYTLDAPYVSPRCTP